MNLLLRFYDPQDGGITLDGHSIKDLNIRYLRSQMGYVGQEPVLFTGTVAENIAYGIPPIELETLTPEETRRRVVEAAKLANAHDFISSFPSGYDTDVGSNGVAMSGGQKQRIAIARALVKKPAVLLLDEATSALDATSERVVQESIDQLQRSHAQTTIVIAHRLSTIRNADKIAVVHNGVIAELGKHEELIALGGAVNSRYFLMIDAYFSGIYKDLVSIQMSNDIEDETPATEEDVISADVQKDPSSAQLVTAERALSAQKVNAKDATPAEVEIPKEEASKLNRKIWALVLQYKAWLLVALSGAIIFGSIFPLWGLILAKTQTLFYYTDTARIRSSATNVAIYFILLGTFSGNFNLGLSLLVGVACLVGGILQYGGVAQVGERVSMQLRGASPQSHPKYLITTLQAFCSNHS